MYNIMMQNIQKNSADICICGIKNEGDNFSSSTSRYEYLIGNCFNNCEAINLLTRSTNNNYLISPVVWNKVYKTSLIRNNNLSFLPNSYWEDDIFSFMIFMYADKVSIVSNIYYHYYIRASSITNSFSKKHIDDLLGAFEILKNKLIEKDIYDYYQYQFKSFFDRCMNSLANMLIKNEPTVSAQKQYYKYLYTQYIQKFSITEAIDYFDIQRLHRLFM